MFMRHPPSHQFTCSGIYHLNTKPVIRILIKLEISFVTLNNVQIFYCQQLMFIHLWKGFWNFRCWLLFGLLLPLWWNLLFFNRLFWFLSYSSTLPNLSSRAFFFFSNSAASPTISSAWFTIIPNLSIRCFFFSFMLSLVSMPNLCWRPLIFS